MNADWAPGGRQPSDQTNRFGLWVRRSAATIRRHHRHFIIITQLVYKLILILPSHGGWKAVTKYERCNGAGTQGTVSPFLCIHRQVANNRRREALCFLAVRLSVRPAGLSVKNGVRVTPYLSLYLRHFNEYVWLGIIEKIRGQMFKVIWSNALYWLRDTHRLTSVRPWSVNTYFSWRGSRDISVGRLSGSISMKFGPNIHGVWVSIAALTA